LVVEILRERHRVTVVQMLLGLMVCFVVRKKQMAFENLSSCLKGPKEHQTYQ
jgi:hypothetical protein